MATAADWYAGIQKIEDDKAKRAGLDPVVAQVMAKYGYLSGYLDHPEIGPILRQAAAKGWSKELLQGALYKTHWWKQWNTTQRELQMLEKTDPAEYANRVQSKIREIQAMATQGGAAFTSLYDVTSLAKSLLGQPNLSPETVQFMVFAHAQYKAGQAQGGTMGATMDSVKARASEFFVPLSDQTAFDWAKRIAEGMETAEGFDTYVRNQAKSRYAHFVDDIDRGATLKELFDPYVQQTAELLEVAPDTIDLTDPKYKAMISTKDRDTLKPRAMTLSEADEFVKRSDAYKQTKGSMNKTAEFVENLARTFGKVKA